VRIAAIHLYKSDITKVEIDVNSVKIIDASAGIIALNQEDYGRQTNTTEKTVIDFMLDGDIYRALSTKGVQDFRIKPTITTAGLVTTYVEYLDSFEGV